MQSGKAIPLRAASIVKFDLDADFGGVAF